MKNSDRNHGHSFEEGQWDSQWSSTVNGSFPMLAFDWAHICLPKSFANLFQLTPRPVCMFNSVPQNECGEGMIRRSFCPCWQL